MSASENRFFINFYSDFEQLKYVFVEIKQKKLTDNQSNLENNDNKVKHYTVNKINLDNPQSKELIKELEWINIEVDFVPFWSLIHDSKRIKSIRGNVGIVEEII